MAYLILAGLSWAAFTLFSSATFVDIASVQYAYPLLGEALLNTAIVFVGVLTVSTLLGVSLAYAFANYRFRFKRSLLALSCLPLSIPPYIMATAFMTTPLRYSVPSLPGLIAILSFSVFPYVLLIMLPALQSSAAYTSDIAQYIGKRRAMQVTARGVMPVLFAAMFTVAFDVASEFGATSILNQLTMTTLIYKVWANYRAPFASALLAIAYAAFFVALYRIMHKDARTHRPTACELPVCNSLTWAIASVVCVTTVVPLGAMLIGSVEFLVKIPDVSNTLIVTLTCVGVTVMLALTMMKNTTANFLATSLYALPSITLSLLALYALTYVKQLAFLSFSVGAVIAVVSLRYVMIARNTMRQPWSNATKHYIDLLQYMPRRSAVWHVYIRNDMAAVLAASVLVALEVVKELPITLMLRPADFETLATRVYSYANEGYYEQSYPAALLIVAVSAVLGGLYANNRHR